MRFLKAILSLVIICTAYLGDFVVFKSKYSASFPFRAISDSIVHGSLGFLSSLMFFSYENNLNSEASALNVLFCTILSSFIDIDHIFVAKSIYLKDLTNLKQRGIFHCTTFFLLITVILLLYSYLNRKLNIYILTFMVVLAFSSHHIRDGNRRGLWLYPFGSSPPIDKNLYVFLLAVLPHVTAYFYLLFKGDFTRHVFVDYTAV
ncbi:transmembrane protein 267 [Anticarsia gemmatalis]|uniref:transmembrane protein 267 n=1 Tax=Anticarsia gemmatalis TaxID=129554 RepID=UPI003F77295B